MDICSAESEAGWLTLFRLNARGLTGVKLVTSDAHSGLVAAMTATLDGAAWQRCRTHYAANLMSATPKSSWGWVKAMLHSIYDQPDAKSVHAQFYRVIDTLALAVKRISGYCPDVGGLVPRATPWEHLQLAARLRPMTDWEERARDLLERFELVGAAHRVAGGFSHGMGRRLSVLLAAFHRPDVLLLDEPFDGVDPLT